MNDAEIAAAFELAEQAKIKIEIEHLRAEVERLTRERDEEICEGICDGLMVFANRTVAAERKVEKLREALRPFSFPRSEWGSKVYAINETISTDWITNARAALAETEKPNG